MKAYVKTEEHKQKAGKASGVTRKLRGSQKGLKHTSWKGEKVGYRGLHYWIERELGKPRDCSVCHIVNKKGVKAYHWANISRTYKREFTDWIRLCATCHSAYDRGKIQL